jgi:hypothetical protein
MAPVETEYYDLVCSHALNEASSGVLTISLRDTLVSLEPVAGCLCGGKRHRFEEGLSEASYEGSL